MNFHTVHHRYYCGADLNARTMELCIIDAKGTILLLKELKTEPDLISSQSPSTAGISSSPPEPEQNVRRESQREGFADVSPDPDARRSVLSPMDNREYQGR